MNLSDMFTKCVSQALFQSFRTALGFLLNDLRLSVVISGSEKQKALDDEEESESLRDLGGKPLGKTSKLTQRVFQVFQLRESFQRGRRCMLCDDVIEDDLLIEGEGEVLNSVSLSAAVVGSAASSLSGVILTKGVMASSSDKDEDRRSVREAREGAMAKEGVPDAKESKKKRRRREKKRGKTPGEESKVDKPKEDEMEEVEVEGEEPAQSSKPPVRPPPVGPPKVKKDHLKQKVDKGRKGKGKGEKGKGKDKGRGKKGKGKGEVASPSKPRSRPPEPPTPPPGWDSVRLVPKAEVMKERKRNLKQILMKRPEKQSRRTRERVQMNLHNLSYSNRMKPRLHLVSQHLLPRASLLLLKRRDRKFQCNSPRDHRLVHPRPCHLHWPGRKRKDLPMTGRR